MRGIGDKPYKYLLGEEMSEKTFLIKIREKIEIGKLDGIFFICPAIVYNRQGLLFAWLWYGMAFYKKTAIEEYTEIVKTSPYWEHKF